MADLSPSDVPPHVPTKGPKGWRRYKQHPVADDGWTGWIRPAQGYRMGCCDCGLVHELEFRVVNVDDVEFRAKRHERATAAKRRAKRWLHKPIGAKKAIRL